MKTENKPKQRTLDSTNWLVSTSCRLTSRADTFLRLPQQDNPYACTMLQLAHDPTLPRAITGALSAEKRLLCLHPSNVNRAVFVLWGVARVRPLSTRYVAEPSRPTIGVPLCDVCVGLRRTQICSSKSTAVLPFRPKKTTATTAKTLVARQLLVDRETRATERPLFFTPQPPPKEQANEPINPPGPDHLHPHSRPKRSRNGTYVAAERKYASELVTTIRHRPYFEDTRALY